MNTYTEKLRDPRWAALRKAFTKHRTDSGTGEQCDDCGEDTTGPLHVHHRLYRKGAEPWEYDFDDLRLICATCHQRIHDTEQRVRSLVLTLSPHVCCQINDLLDELELLPSQGALKSALARARREVINLQHPEWPQ